MTKKNKHWQEREAIKDNIKHDKELAKEINKRLEQLMSDVEAEINRELKAYAKGQNIELSEVYERINEMDVKAFQKKAKEYVKNKDFSATANYELEIYNRKMRINRLEWIKSMLGIDLVNGFDDIEKMLDKALKDSAMRELVKQSGILGDTVMNDYSKVIEKVINGSFHNASFSKRIWQYQNELKAELDKLLTRQMVNGHNPRRVASELRESFKVTKYQAEKMMRTESARIQGELQKSSYERLNIKEYDWVTEPSACPTCKGIARIGPYKVKDMEVGINMIPAHPNCRCSTAPAMEEDYELEYNKQSGGLNQKNDPTGEEREKVAENYYQQVKNRNKRFEIKSVSNNVSASEFVIEKIFNHIFVKKHNLNSGYQRFSPDYDMAQSWQRLREGKNIEFHDIMLLEHELYESILMDEGQSYIDAHNETIKLYDYANHLSQWKKKRGE